MSCLYCAWISLPLTVYLSNCFAPDFKSWHADMYFSFPPFFLFIVTGIGVLCRLTADMPWSDRPGPGSAGGQSSGFVRDSWPLGSLSVSTGTSHAMQCAVHNLKCNRGLLAYLMYIRGRLWDGNQRELWLLMTGCRMCYGKPCCGFYSGTPVDIFERVIVGNHSISLWRRSNFQIRCSIQLKKREKKTLHIQPLQHHLNGQFLFLECCNCSLLIT